MPRMLFNRRTTSGFTLVELLVVVAIITIIVAMLLPAMSKVREQATGISCMGRMRQLALGIEGYAIDYSFVIPVETSYIDSSTGITWVSFYDGLKNGPFKMKKAYVTRETTKATGNSNAFSCPKTTSGTYGILHPQHTTGNYFFTSSSAGWDTFYGVRLVKIQKRTDFVLITDTINDPWSGTLPTAGNAGWATDRYLGGYQSNGGLWLAHNNRANAIFADFHVESCDPGRLRKTWNDNYNSNNQTHGISAWYDVNVKFHKETLP
jgi:prepilin-type N-terminal cleavage/methylation domain-containing protein/prepilin-type processing-associated H-X9-DG protein